MVTNTRSCFMGRPPVGISYGRSGCAARGRRYERPIVISGQLEILEVQRPEQASALSAEPVLAATKGVARHVHDRRSEVLHRGDTRRRRQRVALAREVVLELVECPREQRIDFPHELHLATLQQVRRVIGRGGDEPADRAAVTSEPEIELAFDLQVLGDARLGRRIAPDVSEQLAHREQVTEQRARVVGRGAAHAGGEHPQVADRLESHPWRTPVRERREVVERALDALAHDREQLVERATALVEELDRAAHALVQGQVRRTQRAPVLGQTLLGDDVPIRHAADPFSLVVRRSRYTAGSNNAPSIATLFYEGPTADGTSKPRRARTCQAEVRAVAAATGAGRTRSTRTRAPATLDARQASSAHCTATASSAKLGASGAPSVIALCSRSTITPNGATSAGSPSLGDSANAAGIGSSTASLPTSMRQSR